jgi:hypothetical protein
VGNVSNTGPELLEAMQLGSTSATNRPIGGSSPVGWHTRCGGALAMKTLGSVETSAPRVSGALTQAAGREATAPTAKRFSLIASLMTALRMVPAQYRRIDSAGLRSSGAAA